MLPKLAKINKERRILFIVATNYIRTFDVAISRPGRFDLILQMMPPLASEKMKKWPKLQELKNIVQREDFDTELADLTFLETDSVARRLQVLDAAVKQQQAPELWTKMV